MSQTNNGSTNDSLNAADRHEVVYGVFRETPNAAPGKILARVKVQVLAIFARMLSKARAAHNDASGKHKRALAEVEDLKKQLATIPFYSSDEAVTIPPALWSQVGFWILMLLGVAVLAVDAYTLAEFQSGRTDSFGQAIRFSIPVLSFPVAEAALLAQAWITVKARHTVQIVQGCLAAVLVLAYLYVALYFGSPPIASLFSETPDDTGSIERLRLFFQVLVCLCISGICFSIALASMRKSYPRNRDHQARREDIEQKQNEADLHKESSETLEGVIQEMELNQEDSLLQAESIIDEIDAARQAARVAMGKILRQLNPE